MQPPRSPSAFSLIEVAIAVAVVAVAVVVILGLLGALAKQAGQGAPTQAALRLPDAVTVELRALVIQRGFDALAGDIPVMSAASDDGLLLVAARDGSQVRVLAAGESPARDHYFLIELRRFSSGPLAAGAGGASLAVNARVSWPYRPLTPAGLMEPTPFAERQSVNFNVAVNR